MSCNDNHIAWQWLSPIQRAQLLHFRSDLEWRLEHRCRRCGGQVLRDYEEMTCINCGAPHDEQGNLIEPALAVGMVGKGTHYGPRTPTKRHIR